MKSVWILTYTNQQRASSVPQIVGVYTSRALASEAMRQGRDALLHINPRDDRFRFDSMDGPFGLREIRVDHTAMRFSVTVSGSGEVTWSHVEIGGAHDGRHQPQFSGEGSTFDEALANAHAAARSAALSEK